MPNDFVPALSISDPSDAFRIYLALIAEGQRLYGKYLDALRDENDADGTRTRVARAVWTRTEQLTQAAFAEYTRTMNEATTADNYNSETEGL